MTYAFTVPAWPSMARRRTSSRVAPGASEYVASACARAPSSRASGTDRLTVAWSSTASRRSIGTSLWMHTALIALAASRERW